LHTGLQCAEQCSEQCNERATDTLQHCAHSALRRLQSSRSELADRSWPDDCLWRLAATAQLPAAHAGWPIGAAEEAGKQTKAKSRTKANEIREQREREMSRGNKWLQMVSQEKRNNNKATRAILARVLCQSILGKHEKASCEQGAEMGEQERGKWRKQQLATRSSCCGACLSSLPVASLPVLRRQDDDDDERVAEHAMGLI